MPPKRSFKIEVNELTLGEENIQTFEESPAPASNKVWAPPRQSLPVTTHVTATGAFIGDHSYGGSENRPKRVKLELKIDANELKLGAENIPTLEESLKHGVFVRETRSRRRNRHGPIEKRQTIARDTAERIKQIWIQDFGFPERCFRRISNIEKQIEGHLTRLTLKSLKADLKEVWLAKLGTIIDLLRCRCKISFNATLNLHQVDCSCQDLHKVPNEKLEFLYKQRERSERHIQAAMAVISEKRQIRSREKRKKEEEAVRLKKEIRDAWNEKMIKKKKRQKMDRFSEWMDKYGWQYKMKNEPKEEISPKEISQFGEERILFQAVLEKDQRADCCEFAESNEIKVERSPIKKELEQLEELCEFDEDRNLVQAVFEKEERADFFEVVKSSELISEIEVEHNPIKKEVEQLEEVGEFVETFPTLDYGTFSTKRVYRVFKRRRNEEITDGKTFGHESVSQYSIHQDHDYCYNGGADIDPLKIDNTEISSFVPPDIDIKEEDFAF